MNNNYKKYNFEDFTEINYKKLLILAKKKYEFSFFNLSKNKVPTILWRHDVDISINRAYRLAQIENSLNVKSTYFLHIHSIFYNLFEKNNSELIKNILNLGHQIGLHFEPQFYSEYISNKQMKQSVKFEKDILEKLFKTKIRAISFHNPTRDILDRFNQERICGLFNTYGKKFKNFEYVSDSNGYWRFKRLEDILKEPEITNLQVLTHPEWWQKNPMSPNDRIERAISYRGKNVKKSYLKLLNMAKRKSIH